MKSLQQRGAGHIVAILAVVVLAVVGVSGYVVMKAQDKTNNETTTTKVIETDLTESSKELDQANNELDESLDTTELDKDIDAML